MIKKTAATRKSAKPGNGHRVPSNNGKHASTMVESILPTGSLQRTAAGVAVAAGGALFAASTLGVGPAALAGTAGYLAYRASRGSSETNGREKMNENGRVPQTTLTDA